eukprot:364917-Chlamydomonas_euryale.AAC.4
MLVAMVAGLLQKIASRCVRKRQDSSNSSSGGVSVICAGLYCARMAFALSGRARLAATLCCGPRVAMAWNDRLAVWPTHRSGRCH